jgi:hypothetical protein
MAGLVAGKAQEWVRELMLYEEIHCLESTRQIHYYLVAGI